jgi:ABC-2 type transport system permease protein
VIGAALYLARRSLVNALRRRLRRLRQPKYLIGFAVGLLYYYAFFLRPRQQSAGAGALHGSVGEVVAMMGLTVLVLIGWLFGSSRSPLTYTPAETHFLFTAPLTRRQVLDFKLLRSQLALGLSSLLSVLLFSGGHFPATRVLRVLGLWLVFAALQMHSAVTALVRQSLEEHGVTAVRRRVGAFLLVAVIAGAAVLALRGQMGPVQDAFAEGPDGGFDALAALLHRGVLGVITWPLAALVRPALAPDLAAFAARLPAALLVVGAHYVWLIRSSTAFEEVAVESAERMATRIAAYRSGRRPPPLAGPAKRARPALTRLAATGRPALAIAWKNVQAEWRGSGVRLPVIVTIGVIAVAWIASMGEEAGTGLQVLATLLLLFGAMAVVFGPYGLRNDLRSDLQLWDLIKSYPLRGAELVAGEVLGPVTVLTAMAWACLLGSFTLSLGLDAPTFSVTDRLAALLAAVIATPAFLTITTLIQNAAVLFFPAWITVGPQRAAGVEMIGQRLVTMVGSAVLLALALIPAAIVGAVAVAIGGVAGITRVWLAVPASVAVAVTLVFEATLAFAWLGRVFERSDPVMEIGGGG